MEDISYDPIRSVRGIHSFKMSATRSLRGGSRWWTATAIALDAPFTLLLVMVLSNKTMQDLWKISLDQARSADLVTSKCPGYHGAVTVDLVAIAVVRQLLLWITYVCCGSLNHCMFILVLLSTLVYLSCKLGYMYNWGTTSETDPDGLIIVLVQAVTACIQSFMLNLLIRRWKAEVCPHTMALHCLSCPARRTSLSPVPPTSPYGVPRSLRTGGRPCTQPIWLVRRHTPPAIAVRTHITNIHVHIYIYAGGSEPVN